MPRDELLGRARDPDPAAAAARAAAAPQELLRGLQAGEQEPGLPQRRVLRSAAGDLLLRPRLRLRGGFTGRDLALHLLVGDGHGRAQPGALPHLELAELFG